MKFRTIRREIPALHTVDGTTEEITRTEEVRVPVLPKDWDTISTHVAVGLVMSLTAVSILWSTWSIGELLGGGLGYSAAAVFDLAWAVCIILEWKARFDPEKRQFPKRLGWALLAATMGAIAWHGIEAGSTGMAVVGAGVSLFAKVLWLGVMKHVDKELSPEDQAWVKRQISRANAKAAVASVRRQTARIEHRAAAELLAMEAEAGMVGMAAPGHDASEPTAGAPAMAAGAPAPAAVAPATDAPALAGASAPAAPGITAEQLAAALALLAQTQATPVAGAPAAGAPATAEKDATEADATDATEEGETLPPLEPPTLASLAKADAIRIALRRRPGYTNAQVADLLAGHGVKTTADYVRQVRNRDSERATEEAAGEVVQLRKDA